jgi:membrane-associated phospholipid phosphatase
MSNSRSYYLLFISLCLAIAGGLLALYPHFHEYFPGDLRVSLWVQSLEYPQLTHFLKGLAWVFGNWRTGILVVLAGILVYWKYGKLEAAMLAAAGIISWSNEGIKLLIARPRPTADQVNILVHESNYSFPSSHAFFASLFFGSLICLLITRLRPGLWRSVLISALILIILLVGFSRIYLGVHWYSDVIAGYVFGGFFLTILIAGYRILKARLLF